MTGGIFESPRHCLSGVGVVALIITAENFAIEFRPLVEAFTDFPVAQTEGVACGSQRDQRFAVSQVPANHIKLSLRQAAAADGPDRHVGGVQNFDAGNVVSILAVGVDVRDLEVTAKML